MAYKKFPQIPRYFAHRRVRPIRPAKCQQNDIDNKSIDKNTYDLIHFALALEQKPTIQYDNFTFDHI